MGFDDYDLAKINDDISNSKSIEVSYWSSNMWINMFVKKNYIWLQALGRLLLMNCWPLPNVAIALFMGDSWINVTKWLFLYAQKAELCKAISWNASCLVSFQSKLLWILSCCLMGVNTVCFRLCEYRLKVSVKFIRTRCNRVESS